MNSTTDAKELILKYWNSWQNADWDVMFECLQDEIDFGGHSMSRDQFTDMCRNGTPWKEVKMLSSVFGDNSGALLYEGTDTKSGNVIRVGEFIQIENGRIKSSLACFGGGMPPQ